MASGNAARRDLVLSPHLTETFEKFLSPPSSSSAAAASKDRPKTIETTGKKKVPARTVSTSQFCGLFLPPSQAGS